MFRATLLLAEARRTCLPGSYTVVQHLQTPGLPEQVGAQRLSSRSLIHATNPSLTNSERLFHNERRQVINRSARAVRSFTANPLASKSHTGHGTTLDCRRPSISGA